MTRDADRLYRYRCPAGHVTETHERTDAIPCGWAEVTRLGREFTITDHCGHTAYPLFTGRDTLIVVVAAVVMLVAWVLALKACGYA